MAAAVAFGRLCVETKNISFWAGCGLTQTVAFGRLCVETKKEQALLRPTPAVAFGRLCVETVHSKRH